MRRFFLLLTLVAHTVLLAQTITVKVKETRIRSSPKFYAKAIGRTERGDRLEKTGELKGWYEVRTAEGKTGWVHSSAVEVKRLRLESGEWVEIEASPDEVALAGKGFNEEVEAEYRRTHSDLDYTWVDRMEKIEIEESEAVDFLKQGRLGEYGGGK